jgi:hypothetical protein
MYPITPKSGCAQYNNQHYVVDIMGLTFLFIG